MRSHVVWRLLRARVRELDKEVLIISSDRQIRSVVKGAGFKVFDSQEATPKKRSGSRTIRSILERLSYHEKTPPRQDVPGRRISDQEFDNPRTTSLRTNHPKGSKVPLNTIIIYVKKIALALQYILDAQINNLAIQPASLFVGTNNEILLGGFEWLCGNVPFQGEWMQIHSQHKRVTPPSLREQNPDIPHEVEEVVMKALSEDPEKRYESIQEFAEALEEAILPPTADRFVFPDRSGEQFGKYILVRRLGQGGARYRY